MEELSKQEDVVQCTTEDINTESEEKQMTIKETIEILEKEIECKRRFYNGTCRIELCERCDVYIGVEKEIEAYKMAVKALEIHRLYMPYTVVGTQNGKAENMSAAADVEKDNAGSEDNAENEAVAAVAEDDNVESEDDENEEMDEAAVVEESLKNDAITSAHNIANVLIGAAELNGDVMDWAIKESLALTRKLCELQDMEGLPE